MKRLWVPITLLLLSVLAANCTGYDVCLTPEFGCEGTTGTNVGPVSFEADVVPLLGGSCGNTASCHMSPGQDTYSTDPVALDCQGFFTELTEPRVGEATTDPRLDPAVDPSDPTNTFFIVKGDGGLAHGGVDQLTDQQFNLLVGWVSQNAINDCP